MPPPSAPSELGAPSSMYSGMSAYRYLTPFYPFSRSPADPVSEPQMSLAGRTVLGPEAPRVQRPSELRGENQGRTEGGPPEKKKQQPEIMPIDYQGLKYVADVDRSLLCPICITPLHDPVTTKDCGHTFCRKCLSRALEEKRLCPLCREEVPQRECPVTSLILKEQLNRLRVKCPNDECDSVITKEALKSHYEDHCEWTRVPCGGKGMPARECTDPVPRRYKSEGCKHHLVSCVYCRKRVLEADTEQHHKLECDGAKRKCEQCGLDVARHRMDHHKSDDCSEGIATCKWRSHGCRISEKKSSLSGHEDTCVYAAIAELSTKVAKLEEARVKDSSLIKGLLESRVHDRAEIKHLKDKLALRPSVGDANDVRTCSYSELFKKEPISIYLDVPASRHLDLDVMASRVAAMDSTLGTVVPALETVVHKHDFHVMHTDMLNRLRQVDMRLDHVDRDRQAPGAERLPREAHTATVQDTNAAQPRPQQQQQQDADGNAPVRRPAQNNTSTLFPPRNFRNMHWFGVVGSGVLEPGVPRRRRSADGQRNDSAKL